MSTVVKVIKKPNWFSVIKVAKKPVAVKKTAKKVGVGKHYEKIIFFCGRGRSGLFFFLIARQVDGRPTRHSVRAP